MAVGEDGKGSDIVGNLNHVKLPPRHTEVNATMGLTKYNSTSEIAHKQNRQEKESMFGLALVTFNLTNLIVAAIYLML